MGDGWRNSKCRKFLNETYSATVEKQIKGAIRKPPIPIIAIQSSTELEGKNTETNACSSAWKYWALGQEMKKRLL